MTVLPARKVTDRLNLICRQPVRLEPDWALQDPMDYVRTFQRAVPAAVRQSGVDPADVIGLGIDFTACTMLPVLADPGFKESVEGSLNYKGEPYLTRAVLLNAANPVRHYYPDSRWKEILSHKNMELVIDRKSVV